VFLEKLIYQNRPLVEYALYCHRKGLLLPDIYLLDADAIAENARLILEEADRQNVKLYFMLKQIGRIPFIGKMLMELGYDGAVCVDFREALTMIKNGVTVGHVGHLVQAPDAALEMILKAEPEIMTVYSLEKAKRIGEICSRLGKTQDIMLRMIDNLSDLYPGQHGGFILSDIGHIAEGLERMRGIRIAGVCSFPCVKFDECTAEFVVTPNKHVVVEAAELLTQRGHGSLQINLPSCTCVKSLPLVSREGGTHAEPGHGLTGTTPYHALPGSGPERTALLYLSEISHNLGSNAYCYGGGWYRRGGLKHAMIGSSIERARVTPAISPLPDSIDYHIELEGRAEVGDPVIMCFRTQLFVTRSEIAVVSGLSCGEPLIEGVYTTGGNKADTWNTWSF